MVEIAGGILLAIAAIALIGPAIGVAMIVGPFLLALLMWDMNGGWFIMSYFIFAMYAIFGINWIIGEIKK